MDSTFIATQEFNHPVDCFCASQKHANTIYFQIGDQIFISEGTKFVESLGWYVRVVVNQSYQFFIHADDLEALLETEKIKSAFDVSLETNFYEYKINQALDEKDENGFHTYVVLLEKSKAMLYPGVASPQ
ncbi:hypothetical protein MUN89_13035 [Halobacillus salinarum]|uniref:Uncharacterized protein n=1 Tax=Halobacillus salinarum TaxID=2932257 RepID=A0ABY4EFE9_9BACI|nr:hypothetical protein [Halobacillus salinarum]UOQ42886.1 hypothetical protein MUN89_13035 [Halobacillus salinarum]